MIANRLVRWLCFYIVLVCIAAFGQQQAPTSDSQLPDAPQPQAQPPEPPAQAPPAEQPAKEDKKPESKLKRTLKRGKPDCIRIMGSEKCKEPSSDDEEASEGQQQPPPKQPPVPQSQPMPRMSHPDESSSKDTGNLGADTGSGPAADVQELHPYNPHKADKDVEVGDFYFKRNNYRAAESRFAEALEYMPNHAEATFKLAESKEKLGKTAEARTFYEKYLKILPQGEFAKEAREALARLDAQSKQTAPTSPPSQNPR